MPSFIDAIAKLFVMFVLSASSSSQSWTITTVHTKEPNFFYVTYAAMLSDTKVGPKPSVLIPHNYFGPEEKLIRKKPPTIYKRSDLENGTVTQLSL